MSKLALTNLVNLQNETTAVNAINSNNAATIAAMDKALFRDGTSPDQMTASLDMNSNRIINLPAPLTGTEPLRLDDFAGAGSLTLQNLTLTGTLIAPNAQITGGHITGMPLPTQPSDVVNKQYVDSFAVGISIKAAVRLATAAVLPNAPNYANGASGVGATLTSTSFAALTVDGTSVSVADRILVKDQASTFQNGVYTVTTVGDGATNWVLTRATDFDQSAEMLVGSYFVVNAGTTNLNFSYVLSGTVTTVGTTAVLFNRFGNGVIPNLAVSNVASLKLVPVSSLVEGQIVTLRGYFTQNDGGEGIFVWDSTNVTAQNNGTIFQITGVATGRFIRLQTSGIVNVKWFGAKGDNSTDDATALTSAITLVTANGGTLFLPPGIYCTTAALTIGNGNSTTQSTINKITLQGSGGGFNLTTPVAGGSTIKYIGSTNAGFCMLTVNGPATSIGIKDISFDGAAKVGICLTLNHIQWSEYRNLTLANFIYRGCILTSYPTTSSVAWGCNNNSFDNINITTSGTTSAVGLIIGPSSTGGGILDCAQNIFTGVIVRFFAGTSNRCIQLQFTDACTWINTLTDHGGGAGSVGIFIQPTLDTPIWPAGHLFYNSFIIGSVSVDPTWTGVGIGFFGYGTGDGEIVPTNAGIFGWTNEGVAFSPQITVSGLSNAILPYKAGLIILTDVTVTGCTGLYLLGGPAVGFIGQSSGTPFVNPTASPASNKYSVNWDGANYRIYNGNASTVTFGIGQMNSRRSN